MKPRISSFCHEGGSVGVTPVYEGVLVCSTRTPGPSLFFDHDEWDAFLAGVRNGEFDLKALRGGPDA